MSLEADLAVMAHRMASCEERLATMEAKHVHMDNVLNEVLQALQPLRDPMGWIKENWLPLLIIGGAFTIVGGGSVGAVLKILSGLL